MATRAAGAEASLGWLSGGRSRPPDQTWRELKPHLRHLGISRVTDITQLDKLGLPVYASVRPRGQMLRVHAGKGLCARQARVGAAVEATELAMAEAAAAECAASGTRRSSTLRLWLDQLPPGLALRDFCPNPNVGLRLDEPTTMMRVEWLGHSKRVALPAALVHPMTNGDAAQALFPWSSTGLAGGNGVTEATTYALLEVLERDTLALHQVRDDSARLDPVEWPAWLRTLQTSWRSQGVEVYVRALPNVFGLPCFRAWLHEPGSSDVNLAEGSGLHLQPDTALARAVCEAAQSRLSTLHGGREDVADFYAKYSKVSPPERLAQESALLAEIDDRQRQVRWNECPAQPPLPMPATLAWLRHKLEACGLHWVLRYKLSFPGRDLSPLVVVKLVVPRCETLEHGSPRLGPRLAARLLGRDAI